MTPKSGPLFRAWQGGRPILLPHSSILRASLHLGTEVFLSWYRKVKLFSLDKNCHVALQRLTQMNIDLSLYTKKHCPFDAAWHLWVLGEFVHSIQLLCLGLWNQNAFRHTW